MDVKQVGSFIRGQGNPTYETLRRLCKGLPVTLGELVTLAEKLEEGQEPDGQALSSDV
jgi:transcriptional regulator with XRE-family HTH domain